MPRPAPRAAATGRPAPQAAAGRPAGSLDKKEQRELETLPARIEKLESELGTLSQKLADPDLYTRDREQARGLQDRHAALERELAEGYRRWESLEARR